MIRDVLPYVPKADVPGCAGEPTQHMARLEMEGDRFRVEGELIVFHDSAQARGRPTGAASTAGLLYVRSDNQSDATTGYEVEGRFAMDGTTSILTAAGAEAFFTSSGLPSSTKV